MIGIIEKVLCNLILQHADEKTLRLIYQKAGIEEDRVFETNQYYDEAEFRRFLSATLKTLGLDVDTALTLYADAFFKYTKALYPSWYAMVNTAKEFLQLQVKIHDGFGHSLNDLEKSQRLMKKIKVDTNGNGLMVTYCSENRLCGLYIKLAERVGEHYGDKPTLTHEKCMHKGAEECVINVDW